MKKIRILFMVSISVMLSIFICSADDDDINSGFGQYVYFINNSYEQHQAPPSDADSTKLVCYHCSWTPLCNYKWYENSAILNDFIDYMEEIPVAFSGDSIYIYITTEYC